MTGREPVHLRSDRARCHAVIADQRRSLPSPAKPILPLWLRPALLAGVSIVEHAQREEWTLTQFELG
ncbi:MAG: hypothetical protein EKK29_20575 [Hyphomicrobiales bacterium]|nr:MAG: hypothetical protein EKK29_20575 [Hyphomicrobiales bacterium]